jgi:hypothetical protein
MPDRALTLALMAMFLLFLAGDDDGIRGDSEQLQHGHTAISMSDYLATGTRGRWRAREGSLVPDAPVCACAVTSSAPVLSGPARSATLIRMTLAVRPISGRLREWPLARSTAQSGLLPL